MSILANYYRLPPAEREKVMHDQAMWDEFRNCLLKAQFQAFQAIAKLNVDGLTREERMAKINATLKEGRDPRQFNMEKDWHVVAYLLTGEVNMAEEHVANKPLHN